MTVPRAIREALPGWGRAELVGNPLPVSRGQIRGFVQAPQEGERVERLALVLRVDDRREFAEIVLVHPYVELAAGTDLVVPPEHSRVPYRVVVETDVRGVVWLTQIGPPVGTLDQLALEALGAVSLGEAPAPRSLLVGLPLRGRFDRRWDFKAAEGSALRTLAADCTASLLDGRAPLQLDIGILSPVLLAASDRESALLKLLDIVSKRDVVFDLDDVKRLDEIGALEVDNWTEAFGSIGVEYYESFLRPLIDRASSAGAGAARAEPDSPWVAGRRPEAGEFRARPGLGVVSATYVRSSDRDRSVSLANELDLELIDA
ncbi:MAG: hypothetical protein OXB92_14870 [Acidimicrobiaceae bacterium]|nr:hypothetical protein [Acidimicrobiaceae bacterium]